ncbi:hypothetical protein [Nocardia cerradoensis]|uniref:hypothetical protein n=1 Tax=Nocardia cerradoensis TaxID=85688 RepID=UPI00118131AE|nr:hypothetical protein [Nocardia cerradoensis]
MTEKIQRTTTWFATLALAGIVTAIPVMAIAPTAAAPTTGQSMAQPDRPWGSVHDPIASAPLQIWAPSGCGNGSCLNHGQYNNNHAATTTAA